MADEPKITQADIDKAVKDAVAAAKTEMQETFEAETEGLKNKNKELLTKLREASGVKPEDLAAVEQELTQAKADLAEATKQVKTLTTERDKAVERADGAEMAGMKSVKDAFLADRAAKMNILGPLIKGFYAEHSDNVVVEVVDGAYVAKIKDGSDPDKYFTEWGSGETGKAYVSALNNTGGGAPGGKGGAEPKTMTRAEYNEKIVSDPKGTNAFLKDGGKIVDQAA